MQVSSPKALTSVLSRAAPSSVGSALPMVRLVFEASSALVAPWPSSATAAQVTESPLAKDAPVRSWPVCPATSTPPTYQT